MDRTYMTFIAGLVVSAQAAFAGTSSPQVLVMPPPLKPYVDELLAGVGESHSLLRGGQDAHLFMLSPSQRHALQSADIIIVPSRTMTPSVKELLTKEEKRGAKIIALVKLEGADALPYADEQAWLKEAGTHGGEKRGTDPHLWMDPVRMATIAKPLAATIAQASPEHRETLEVNAAALKQHLTVEVDPAIANVFANARRSNSMSAKPQVPFVTYHAAYQYFLKRYKLGDGNAITERPEEYLGAKTLHDVLANANKLSIRCIISESDSAIVRQVAKGSGARIVKLSPEVIYAASEVRPADWVKNDYDRLLYKTALTFAECL